MSNAQSQLAEIEFTLKWYRKFLRKIQDAGFAFRTFQERDKDGVFLRHDIDLSIGDALEIARIESNLGVESTYFFLLTSPMYNPFQATHKKRINEIFSLGHDIGLHFSTHQYWSKSEIPSASAIAERVQDEMTALDSVLDIDVASTISFHIPPDWVLNREFAEFQSTYEPALFSDIGYVADSGQRWRRDPPTLNSFPDSFQILTHPGLWSEDDASFEQRIEQAVSDSVTRTRLLAHSEFIEGVHS